MQHFMDLCLRPAEGPMYYAGMCRYRQPLELGQVLIHPQIDPYQHGLCDNCSELLQNFPTHNTKSMALQHHRSEGQLSHPHEFYQRRALGRADSDNWHRSHLRSYSDEQPPLSSPSSIEDSDSDAGGFPMNQPPVDLAQDQDPGRVSHNHGEKLTPELQDVQSYSTQSSGRNLKRSASSDGQNDRKRTPPRTISPNVRSPGRSLKHARSTSKNSIYPLPRSNALYSSPQPMHRNVVVEADFVPKKFGARIDSGYGSRTNTFQSQKSMDVNAQAPVTGLLPGLNPDPRKQIINPSPRGPKYDGIMLQPDSVAITQEQLAAEVKGIYAGLVMVEAKCINIDAEQAANTSTTIGPETWQALIALHRTLLYAHHDFLMATQHPSANPALKNLASKYCMPARMWKHGIHAFLEVLRHRRPDSQEYMLTFIYLAYQMMDLLFETVPSFLDTWIECLGDLARYRMAIEEDKEVHATWGSVAARWYTMAADRHPRVGRLYHHLGILEKPSLRKLFFYARSLTSVSPFLNARESLGTLCAPILQDDQAIKCGSHSAEAMTICFHARVFSGQPQKIIERDGRGALNLLMEQTSGKIASYGVALAVTNIAALFEYGLADNVLRQLYAESLARDAHNSRPSVQREAKIIPQSTQTMNHPDIPQNTTYPSEFVVKFYASCFNSLIRRQLNLATIRDLLQYVHINLVWFSSLLDLRAGMQPGQELDFVNTLLSEINWADLAIFLNALTQIDAINDRIKKHAKSGEFILPERRADNRPLGEDYQIRGIVWVENYLSPDVFQYMQDDDGSRALETQESLHNRAERVEWLACCIAREDRNSKLEYNEQSDRFSMRKEEVSITVDDISVSINSIKEDTQTRESVPVSPRSATNTLSRPSSATGDYEMISAPSDVRSINSKNELLSTPQNWQQSSRSVMTSASREAVAGTPERKPSLHKQQDITDVRIAGEGFAQ